MEQTMTAIAERLSEDVARRIRTLIRDRGLEAGMRMPSERQLALQLGVSRNSLREAIAKLISEGVLLSRHGGGTFVRWQHEAWSEHNIVQPLKTLLEDDPDYSFDILEARHAIEGVPPGMRPYAPPIEKEKIRLCFEATLAEDRILRHKRTSAFTWQLPRRRTISYCCRPCAAFSTCCKAR
jgi:GntR family L-lactate dehydrogenase operon transcriptional regulator